MTTKSKLVEGLLPVALVLAVAAPALGVFQRQPQNLYLPRPSPGAEVGQVIGVTEVTIEYHRPGVKERTIWGGLVPWDEVWRAGANENTRITFSDDVSVQGQPLSAGTYGLHMIPHQDAPWEVIFSREADAWGSFAYDPAHDALRVSVQPEEAPMQERLVYTFDGPEEDSAVVAMRWEKVRVPIEIEVDTPARTVESLRDQLTGLPRFFWAGWNQAASYVLAQEMEETYPEALEWIDQSIQVEERFENLATKAQLLEKTGKAEESHEVLVKALDMAGAMQLHQYARQLIGRGEKEEALAIFQRNLEENPDTWFVELGMARGYSALGRFEEAVRYMKMSLDKAPEDQKAYVQGLVERLERKEDIN